MLITDQMRIPQLLHHLNVSQLDVKVLNDRFQGAAYLDVVLEFNSDFMVDKGLEETVWQRLSVRRLNRN